MAFRMENLAAKLKDWVPDGVREYWLTSVKKCGGCLNCATWKE